MDIGEDQAGVQQRVFSASRYVADRCNQNPELLNELQASGDLSRSYKPGDLKQGLQQHLGDCADEECLNRALRLFRCREMVRIIWRDLGGIAPLAETLEDLSELADQCICQSLERLMQWAVEKDGQPRDAAGQPVQMIVLGMGKLGARELNLSSDIDLIFLMPEAGETDGRRPISNEQFFTRLGRGLINSLGKQTADGFVFRVDMRLRPFGDSGPLVVSLDAFESYLATHARGWERYAMIKARVICGTDAATEELTALLRPFIYRRYTDFGVIESIRDMKRAIEAELRRKGIGNNIKLGRGGIREIEFIGQAFQLARGGRETELQQRPILAVLTELGRLDLLPDYVVAELHLAYDFLRRVENRLQAWRDEQTHDLPEDPEGQARIAATMGFRDWEAFSAELDWHRRRVHGHFQKVFASPQVDEAASDAPMADVWQLHAAETQHLELLAEAGYAQPELVLEALDGVRNGAACRAMSERGRARLDQLMPMLLDAVGQSPHPDATLERLLALLTAVLRRTAYLDLLVENPLALSQLIRLGGESAWVVSQLTRQPVLLDELLDPTQLYSPLRRSELEAELGLQLNRIDQDDLEQQMEGLRQFALGNRLRVAAADIVGAIPTNIVSDYLSEIAEVVLGAATALAWQQLESRHGAPEQIVGKTGFAVLAYGKLGGIELGYGSDLDLVFLHGSESVSAMTGAGDGRKSVANDVFYARMGQRLVHLLTTRTHTGVLYEVDMRLRPNGNAGMLVSSLNAFQRYQENDAWTWEHQALLRARPVAGDADVIARFQALRRDILTRERDPGALRTEVVEMRAKMRTALDKSTGDLFDPKQGVGGIADIEFMVQYAVLRWAHQYPDLIDWTDNLRLLDGLASHGLMSGTAAKGLQEAYLAFRAVQHRCALKETSALLGRDQLVAERELVRANWQDLME